MFELNPLIITVGVLLFFVLDFVIFYSIVKSQKREIKVILNKNEFLAGEALSGSVKVKTLRDLEAEKVELIITASMSTKSKLFARSSTIEIFSTSLILAQNKKFKAKSEEVLEFTTRLPPNLKDIATKKIQIGQVNSSESLQSIESRLFSLNRLEILGKASARLHIPGIDMRSAKSFIIN
jgi:hypothetical protein